MKWLFYNSICIPVSLLSICILSLQISVFILLKIDWICFLLFFSFLALRLRGCLLLFDATIFMIGCQTKCLYFYLFFSLLPSKYSQYVSDYFSVSFFSKVSMISFPAFVPWIQWDVHLERSGRFHFCNSHWVLFLACYSFS